MSPRPTDSWLGMFLDWQRKHWKAGLLLFFTYILFMWLSEVYLPHPCHAFSCFSYRIERTLSRWSRTLACRLSCSACRRVHCRLSDSVSNHFARGADASSSDGVRTFCARRVSIRFSGASATSFGSSLQLLSFLSSCLPSRHTGVSLTLLLLVFTQTRAAWSLRYTGTVFCLLIITPFLLRWFAKPRFSRTPREWMELVVVFGILLAIDGTFLTGMSTVIGIPIVYILLIPLFWVALRLRPRFVTFALLVTSFFALLSLYVGAAVPSAADFGSHLFGIEELFIVLAIIFFVIVSLEENSSIEFEFDTLASRQSGECRCSNIL